MSLTNENDNLTNRNISSDKRKSDFNEDDSFISKKFNLEPTTNLLDDVLINDSIQDASQESLESLRFNEDNSNDNDDSSTDKPILFNGKDVNSLSKSQMKKYKKMLSWEATKRDKRKQEKLRAKQRKREARINNIDIGPSRKQLKLAKMSKSPCKTGVIIDLSFDELMIPKVF